MPNHSEHAARFAKLYGEKKWCKECQAWKDLTQFYVQRTDGQIYLATYCTRCNTTVNLRIRKQTRAWRAKRQRALERMR